MTDMSKVCPRCGAGVRRHYNPAPGRHYWCGSKCAHGIGDLKPSRDCIPPLTPALSPGDDLGGERVLAVVDGRVANVRRNMGTGEGRLLIEPALGHAGLSCDGQPVRVIVTTASERDAP